jgi:hypothetical protein
MQFSKSNLYLHPPSPNYDTVSKGGWGDFRAIHPYPNMPFWFRLGLVRYLTLGLFLLLTPVALHAQPGQASPPPVAPPLAREGDFAIRLETVLGVGTSGDEVEAETTLGNLGISPRNGWIADYPVTPDVIAELQRSVGDVAASGRLPVNKEEALKRFHSLTAEINLPITPSTGTQAQTQPPTPDSTVVNNYYYNEGPPVVTYYAPPPDYSYLYGWVPCPFFYFGFWFPGYYILRDFHRVVVVHGRPVFISNHFSAGANRVFRVDAVARFNGRTYAGIGAPRTGHFLSTGIPRSDRTVFHSSHYMRGGSSRGGASRGGGSHGGHR